MFAIQGKKNANARGELGAAGIDWRIMYDVKK